jgi:hypothetical protein
MLQSKARHITTALGLATALALAPAIPAQAAGKAGSGEAAGIVVGIWDWVVGAWEALAPSADAGRTRSITKKGAGIDPNGGEIATSTTAFPPCGECDKGAGIDPNG